MADFIRRIDKNWTLFLDRDGVINERIVGGYVADYKEFHFLNGVPEAIASFSKFFGKIIIVTNQQGVGKGLMTEEQVNEIHQSMLEDIKQRGGRIDAFYFCPDLKDKPDNCRKPGIKMAEQAKDNFPEIEFSKSIMVGDTFTDIGFGKNAGMFTVFAGIGENPDADLRVFSLKELADLIEKSHSL
ncbi:MAG: HAD-IIIA family hydrolase [Bacteroidales bacterium]|nr:HAD-IIIA family hydrolase [Bacteroidales bacterium]